MLKRGVLPRCATQVRTYTALLTAMGNARQWVRAVETLFMMQQPEYGGVVPNAYTYSALLKSLGEHGQWQLAEGLFSHLEATIHAAQHEGAGRAHPPARQHAVALQRLVAIAAAAEAATQQQHPAVAPQPAGPPLLDLASTAAGLAAVGGSFGGATPLAPPGMVAAAAPAATMVGSSALGAAAPAAGSSAQGVQSTTGSWSSPAQLNGIMLELHTQQQLAQLAQQPPQQPEQPLVQPPTPLMQPPAVALGFDQQLLQLQQLRMSASQVPALGGLMSSPTPPPTPTAGPSSSNFSLFSNQPAAAAAAATYTAAPSPSLLAGSGKEREGPLAPMVNEVVCGALMLAYERAGKWSEAIAVLGRARALGIAPNTVMYNTAISAAGKAGQLDVAEQLFASSPTCDAVTHETLLAAYGMAGQPAGAEQVMRLMGRRGLRPRDYAYCGLIAAHSLAGDCEAALRVRARMRRDGAPATVHVYNALLAACQRAGRYEAALELLQAMKREVGGDGRVCCVLCSVCRVSSC